jgi:hypothetical protein
MTVDRRTLIKSGGVAFGALALAAVASGTSIDQAAAAVTPARHAPLPDPAATPVPNPHFPHHLTREERAQLVTFDELDFVIFCSALWTGWARAMPRTFACTGPTVTSPTD